MTPDQISIPSGDSKLLSPSVFQRCSFVSLFLSRAHPRMCSQHLPGPGDASGGGGLRGGDPERLLHETRQILEPGCPGLRPLLRGLAGNRDSPPEGLASQPQPPPAAVAPQVAAKCQGEPEGPPPSDEGIAADQEFSGSDANVGVGSVLDYGGDGLLAVGGESGGDTPPSSSAVAGVLETADGLFKENGSDVASEANVGMDAAGVRDVFDRPGQSPAPTQLSAGRPQIV